MTRLHYLTYCLIVAPLALGQTPASAVGLFEGHGDVGTVLHRGAAEYDVAKRLATKEEKKSNTF